MDPDSTLPVDLLAVSAAGLLVVDSHGVVRLANPAALELFGRPPDEIVGQPFGLPLIDGSWSEVDVVRNNGQLRAVRMQATDTTWDDEPVQVVSLEDFTDHRIEVDRLTAAVERADEAVANISHELKNPITVISGFAETLKRHWDRLDDTQRLDLIDRIISTGERMSGTVQNLLRLSRVDADVQHQVERVEISGMLFSRLFELGPKAKVVQVTCPPDAAVMADREHVWEILVNFISNAFKYGSPPVEITVKPSGLDTVIRVRDHGDGVDPSFEGELFDRFTRASGHAQDIEGTGLGLSITRSLARTNGGDAWFERPSDGSGSCFAVRLPSA